MYYLTKLTNCGFVVIEEDVFILIIMPMFTRLHGPAPCHLKDTTEIS